MFFLHLTNFLWMRNQNKVLETRFKVFMMQHADHFWSRWTETSLNKNCNQIIRYSTFGGTKTILISVTQWTQKILHERHKLGRTLTLPLLSKSEESDDGLEGTIWGVRRRRRRRFSMWNPGLESYEPASSGFPDSYGGSRAPLRRGS